MVFAPGAGGEERSFVKRSKVHVLVFWVSCKCKLPALGSCHRASDAAYPFKSFSVYRIYFDAGIPFEVMHSHTTADAPETVYFVREDMKRLEETGVSLQSKIFPQHALDAADQIPPVCMCHQERGVR